MPFTQAADRQVDIPALTGEKTESPPRELKTRQIVGFRFWLKAAHARSKKLEYPVLDPADLRLALFFRSGVWVIKSFNGS
jgi:hypothetical protein